MNATACHSYLFIQFLFQSFSHMVYRQISQDTRTAIAEHSHIQKSDQTPNSLYLCQPFYFSSSSISPLLSAQSALGAGNLSLSALNPGSSHANSHGQRLEGTLSPVVVVVAPQAVDVQGDAGGLGKALQAVGDHLAAELAEVLALEAQVDDGVRAVGEIDDGAGEGLVERGVGIAEAGDAGEGTEGLGKGGADGDAAVLGSVVVVNWTRREKESAEQPMQIIDWYSICHDALWRSPLQFSAMLQPACLASAWSMWSRKPMPVLMEITCDLLVCEA